MAGRFLSGSDPSAYDALQRWRAKGLVDAELASTLHREVEEWEEGARRRFGQMAVAVTGGVLLLIAAGVFLARSWPELTPAARTGIIALAGVAVHGAGSLLRGRDPDSVLAHVLRASGLAVLLSSFVYSGEAWADGSASGIVVGVAALLVPVGLLPRALGEGPVPAGVMSAFGYGYLAVFLDRALALELEPLLWVLDGVAVLSILFLLARLARPREDDTHDWALAVLLVSLYAGLILTFLTGIFVLELEEDAVWALDGWLALMAAATLWGIHRAPPRLRRPWYPRHLAWAVLLAIPLTFWTFEGALDTSSWISGGAVAALGAGGLIYALNRDAGHVLVASCLALVIAAWYLGVEVGQALGLVAALAFTAALLFWVSSRVGDRGRRT